MTMDDVNERFPLTKYKAWTIIRAAEGLSTAGGIAGPRSRPASVKEASGVGSEGRSPDPAVERPATATSSSPAEKTEAAEAPAAQPQPHEMQMLETTKSGESHADDDLDEDDQIQTAVPANRLHDPGDSCAICLDTLEDDDDVRGLSCGHAFHAGCIDPWLTSRRACCPLCKADYYVPKPRPDGEPPADAERLPGRHAVSGARDEILLSPPPAAFLSLRGTPLRSRIVLGGRFGPSPPDDHQPPPGQSSSRGWRRERTSDGAVAPGTPPDHAGSWPSRLPRFTAPRLSTPAFLRGRPRPAPVAASAQAHEPAAAPPTPSQLEAGR
jgi:hypothetical protein